MAFAREVGRDTHGLIKRELCFTGRRQLHFPDDCFGGFIDEFQDRRRDAVAVAHGSDHVDVRAGCPNGFAVPVVRIGSSNG